MKGQKLEYGSFFYGTVARRRRFIWIWDQLRCRYTYYTLPTSVFFGRKRQDRGTEKEKIGIVYAAFIDGETVTGFCSQIWKKKRRMMIGLGLLGVIRRM